ncbi:MAG: hypothetical protein RL189_3360 [Pseudomonadota bacterium]
MSFWEGCLARLWGEGEGAKRPAGGGGEAVLKCEGVGTAPRAAPRGAALGASVFCFWVHTTCVDAGVMRIPYFLQPQLNLIENFTPIVPNFVRELCKPADA